MWTIKRRAARAPNRFGYRRATERYALQLETDPLNSTLHARYAVAAARLGLPYLAYAEWKTAECLGPGTTVRDRTADFRKRLPAVRYMEHNRYYRLITLATEILRRGNERKLSILDVGGGQGELAAFLPESARYCLAEPTVNGISGADLPFPDEYFDFVVSCHVLEHIPTAERGQFLDQLLSKAKHGVILLNPFRLEGVDERERLALFVDITGAGWAKQHLECGLPCIAEIRSYAAERGLEIDVHPNGTLTTSTALVFVDYFANKAGCREEWRKLNAFFNDRCCDMLDSTEYPTAYLVYLERKSFHPQPPALGS